MTDIPQLTARIKPSADIQQKVAAAIEARHAWQPVAVSKLPAQTAEAWACGFLDAGPAKIGAGGSTVLLFGAVLGVVGFVLLRATCWGVFSLYRTARARSGDKTRSMKRHIAAGLAGGAGAAFAGLVLALVHAVLG